MKYLLLVLSFATIGIMTPHITHAALDRNLEMGATGNDVVELQTFLIQQGFLSSDSASGYFGPRTRSALIAFQKKNGIVPAEGFLGPKTRQVIASMGRRTSHEGTRFTVGFNDLFLLGSAMAEGYSAHDLPPNSHAITLETARIHLTELSRRGVTAHREIVPVRAFANTQTHAAMSSAIKEFENRSLTLVLALGRPNPFDPSDTTLNNGSCFLPQSDAGWVEMADKIAASLGQFLVQARSAGVSDAWMRTHLIIDPWNEFDAVGEMQADGSCLESQGTPKRAAVLYRAIKDRLSALEIPADVTMPSIAGVYAGTFSEPPRMTPGDGARVWMKDYYATGGRGRPNVHVYYDKSSAGTADGVVRNVRSYIRGFSSAVPSEYKGKTLIGETGIPELARSCTSPGAMQNIERGAALAGLLNDSELAAHVDTILFWRYSPLDNTHPPYFCSYGAISSTDWPARTYNEAGKAIFDAIRPPVSACSPLPPQERALPCPNGQGAIVERRITACPSQEWGPWAQVSNSCSNTSNKLQTPTMASPRCSADGRSVVFSWAPVAGASNYPLRIDSISENGCTLHPDPSASWYCAASGEFLKDAVYDTSYTAAIVPDQTYSWWVHAQSGSNWSEYGKQQFSCPSPVAAAHCSFNGQSVPHGSRITAYAAPSATSCTSEARTCNAGTLSGSYQHATCTPTPASTIPSGRSATCSADGTRVTFSWSSVSGADAYPIRVDNPAVNDCTIYPDPSAAWYCNVSGETIRNDIFGTSFTHTITPGTTYSWWIHSLKGDSWSGYEKQTFTCNDTVSRTNTLENLAAALIAIQQLLASLVDD